MTHNSDHVKRKINDQRCPEIRDSWRLFEFILGYQCYLELVSDHRKVLISIKVNRTPKRTTEFSFITTINTPKYFCNNKKGTSGSKDIWRTTPS